MLPHVYFLYYNMNECLVSNIIYRMFGSRSCKKAGSPVGSGGANSLSYTVMVQPDWNTAAPDRKGFFTPGILYLGVKSLCC